MAYEINYNDQRFQDVEAEKKAAISDVEKTYSGMINQSDAFYQDQINASKEWEKKQTEIQNQQTEFAIDKIEQEKAQAQKDYTKEQSGAYADWQKQSDQYGANAEAMAAQGLQNTGYSESSQVSMYNTYQNRVVAARESFNQIVMDFNNQMTEARLQNSAVLAQIAYEAQAERLKLALEGFQYKNQLIIEQSDKKFEVENQYYNRYQDVLAQINHENALAEQIRQYNTSLAEEQRQYNSTLALQKQQLAEEKRQHDANLAEEKRQYDLNRSLEVQKFEYQKKNYNSGDTIGNNGNTGGGTGGSSGGKVQAAIDKKKSEKNAGLKKSAAAASNLPAGTKKSILALGQGPISAKNLASQVASGKVVETKDKNGNSKFNYNLNPTMLYSRTGLLKKLD